MVSSAENESGFWPSLYAQLRGTELDSREWFSPLASAAADASAYVIRVELPDVAAHDITIKAQQDSLVVEGTKANLEQDAAAVTFFNERLFGHFVRTFRLPGDADLARFTSTLDLGVLAIRVPRRGESDGDGVHPDVVV